MSSALSHHKQSYKDMSPGTEVKVIQLNTGKEINIISAANLKDPFKDIMS